MGLCPLIHALSPNRSPLFFPLTSLSMLVTVYGVKAFSSPSTVRPSHEDPIFHSRHVEVTALTKTRHNTRQTGHAGAYHTIDRQHAVKHFELHLPAVELTWHELGDSESGNVVRSAGELDDSQSPSHVGPSPPTVQ